MHTKLPKLRVPRVSRGLGMMLGMLLVHGCGSSSGAHRSNTASVQLDVTSSGPPVKWTGAIFEDTSSSQGVSVGGTTPSSQRVQIPVSSCQSSSTFICPHVPIKARIVGGFATQPDNTVKIVPFTVCLKDLDTGDHSCDTAGPEVTVTVDD